MLRRNRYFLPGYVPHITASSNRSTAALRSSRRDAKAKSFGARDRRRYLRWLFELENGLASRDDRWSEALAVGGLTFVETVKNELGFKASHRDVIELNDSHALRGFVDQAKT